MSKQERAAILAESEQTGLQLVCEAIAKVEQRYRSGKRRIAELERRRTMFKSYGPWLCAVELLEDQMAIWGLTVHPEHTTLCQDYTQAIEDLSHPLDLKSEWTDLDRYIYGRSRAYVEARYILRFHSLPDSLTKLAQYWSELNEALDGECEYDRQKSRGEMDEILVIIAQLEQSQAKIEGKDEGTR